MFLIRRFWCEAQNDCEIGDLAFEPSADAQLEFFGSLRPWAVHYVFLSFCIFTSEMMAKLLTSDGKSKSQTKENDNNL